MTPSTRRTAALAVLMLLASYVPVPAQSPRAPDAELAAGMALVREGDFEAAVLKLDAVVRRLLADVSRSKEAAQAYVYLGVSFLELNQELVARGKFQQALALDPQLRLDAREFSPQQIRVFEAARAEARPPVASAPSPVAVPGAPPARNNKKKSPLIWILGGAAVVGAGAAAAAGGGGSGAPATMTTAPTGNTTSTTAATQPPDTTTTTTAPPGTTTTTTTVPSTSSTTTSTLPVGCSTASVGGPNMPAYGSLGSGFCSVSAPATCTWSAAVVGNPDWVNLTAGSGTGAGQIRFSLGVYVGPPRQATIFLVEKTSASCTITQTTLLADHRSPAALTFTSDLDLEGAQGQVVVDGAAATFQSRGPQPGAIDPAPGSHRVEATVVSGASRPGTWRFRLAGRVAPSSLRVVAGVALSATADEVVFRLSGRAGQRMVFEFRVP